MISYNTILTIALNVLKSYARDRIFHVAIFVSVILVGLTYAISTLAALQPYKLLLDFGFAAISISGIFISIFLGITALAKEIQDKSIYTILVKPIDRHDYILGKYLGCSFVLIIVHILISTTLSLLVYLLGLGLPSPIIACFYLMTLESLVVLAIALFSSVFSSTILASCFTISIFIIGRSSYFLKTLAEKSDDALTKSVFRFLYDFLPNLDRFNIREVVAYAKDYPDGHIWITSIYFCVLVGFFLVSSSILFSKRDLP